MTDLLEALSSGLSHLLNGDSGTGVIVSEAPGAGPGGQDENKRVDIERGHAGTLPLGYMARHPELGRDAVGYGQSHGDAIVVDDRDDETELIASQLEHARIARVAKKVSDRTPHGRYRMGKWYWLEGHSDQTVGPVVGPYSLFDGTTAAVIAAGVQTVSITMPAGTVSPIFLLDRYPGAMYMSLFISSFALIPTAGTMTGVIEAWFTDAGGAVASLGLYSAATGAAGIQNINKQMSSPLTDPGLTTLGTLTFNGINIGGTAVTARWQLGIGYMAFIADPWFNEQMIVNPTKAENVKSFLPQDAFA